MLWDAKSTENVLDATSEQHCRQLIFSRLYYIRQNSKCIRINVVPNKARGNAVFPLNTTQPRTLMTWMHVIRNSSWSYNNIRNTAVDKTTYSSVLTASSKVPEMEQVMPKVMLEQPHRKVPINYNKTP